MELAVLRVFYFAFSILGASAGAIHLSKALGQPPMTGARVSDSPPPYKEVYFTQQLDHFNYQDQRVYSQRLLWCGEL